MRETATTLTDFLLAIFSFGCALGLMRRPVAVRDRGPLLFFSGFGLAAFCGGLWHGFFSAPGTSGERFVWWLSMLFAGSSAAGLAMTGIELFGFRRRAALLAVMAFFLIPFGHYVWFDPRFLAPLVATACGTLICLAGLLSQFRRGAKSAALLAIVGLALSVAGAIAQQSGVAIHPIHFDHNATYHLFLFPALGFFYAGLRRITF